VCLIALTNSAGEPFNGCTFEELTPPETHLYALAKEIFARTGDRQAALAELKKAFPGHDDFAYSAALLAAGHASTEEGRAEEPLAPISQSSRYQFAHALLPQSEIATKILIPADLARFAFLFSASPIPGHRLQNGSGFIQVGDEAQPSLTVTHQRLLFALYREAQVSGMMYRIENGKPYLEIRTSLPELHRLTTPFSHYGGSAQRRLEEYLSDLRDTKVLFDDGQGSRMNYPFVAEWFREPGGGQRNLVVRLHWRWSQPFADPEKKDIKPFLFDQYVSLTSSYARLLYVHYDWTLSHHPKAELRLHTILERAGALHESQETCDSLRRYTSHQQWRLRYVWQLEGKLLSHGGILTIREEVAENSENRLCPAKKFVATLQSTDKKETKVSKEGNILYLDFYRTRRELWTLSPRTLRRARFASGSPRLA
jgi:hypothetical protein